MSWWRWWMGGAIPILFLVGFRCPGASPFLAQEETGGSGAQGPAVGAGGFAGAVGVVDGGAGPGPGVGGVGGAVTDGICAQVCMGLSCPNCEQSCEGTLATCEGATAVEIIHCFKSADCNVMAAETCLAGACLGPVLGDACAAICNSLDASGCVDPPDQATCRIACKVALNGCAAISSIVQCFAAWQCDRSGQVMPFCGDANCPLDEPPPLTWGQP